MAKKNKGPKIPKTIFGFKLSKGSRKDLRKLIRMIAAPEARAILLSALSLLARYLGERPGEGNDPLSKAAGKTASNAAAMAQPH